MKQKISPVAIGAAAVVLLVVLALMYRAFFGQPGGPAPGEGFQKPGGGAPAGASTGAPTGMKGRPAGAPPMGPNGHPSFGAPGNTPPGPGGR